MRGTERDDEHPGDPDPRALDRPAIVFEPVPPAPRKRPCPERDDLPELWWG